MQELSLNVLDIAQNSVVANASLISIDIIISTKQKFMAITISDNGKGMSVETITRVSDPFYTTRTTRNVGLGIPFFKQAAEQTGGSLTIESEIGKGTKISACFKLGHIDLVPLGDMSGTITSLVQCNPNIDFVYSVTENSETFTMDTRELRKILGEVSFSTPEVALFIKEYLEENSDHILKRSVIAI